MNNIDEKSAIRKAKRRKEQMKAAALLVTLLVSVGILIVLILAVVRGGFGAGSQGDRATDTETEQEVVKEKAPRQEAEPVQETENDQVPETIPDGESAKEWEAEQGQEEAEETEAGDSAAETASEEELLQEKIEQKIAAMTTEEKVAQLFMITPEALTGYSTVTAASDVSRQALQQYPVGGLILFSKNIVDPAQLSEMTGNLQKYAAEISEVPLFLGIDEEGGQVARIAGNSNFDVPKIGDMREIGNSGDTEKAHEAGTAIGKYLSSYGLNLDFAPVADVLTNPSNPILQRRSFGEDAQMVSVMNQAFIEGLHENKVYGCLKHFPGHGGTGGDTHEGYAYTERTREEIEQTELLPFREGIEDGISFIMVSHIGVESITGDNTPASLSKAVITDLLRKEMGYEGIVITDAMNMGAITQDYNSATAAVKAISAGADVVLMPVDFQSAYKGVLDAVASGEISRERLDESLRRILKVKYSME